jgi:hypothetical protein
MEGKGTIAPLGLKEGATQLQQRKEAKDLVDDGVGLEGKGGGGAFLIFRHATRYSIAEHSCTAPSIAIDPCHSSLDSYFLSLCFIT